MILLRQNRPKRKVHNGRILQFGRLMDNRELVVQSTIMRSPKGGGGRASFDPFQRRLYPRSLNQPINHFAHNL